MLKILGSALVIFSAGCAGMTIAREYSQRPKELRDILSGLQMLETEITYGATPLPEALSKVAARCRNSAALLFEYAGKELASMSGCTAQEAWEKALTNFQSTSVLNNSDLAVLRGLGGSLGISDSKDQGKHLRLVAEQLKSQITRADWEAAKNVKLWNYLGFFGGVIVVLVLF